MRPNRRTVLRGLAGAGIASVAGCLERLGFERQSAWRDPPLVPNRPDAVYVPASIEEMGRYGTATAGDYAVALSYTFPHRFWLVSGRETNRVVVDVDDSLHLMASVWDRETGVVLPVDVGVELVHDGELVADVPLWPMLSQRMGVHHGDNVALPAEGGYTASIRVGPVGARRHGAFEGRFEAGATVQLDFEYHESQIHDLAFEPIDPDERGRHGAVPVMGQASVEREHRSPGAGDDGHGEVDDHAHEHPPVAVAPPVDSLPGRLVGRGRSGDAEFVVVESTDDRLLEDGASSSLVVSPRTPHNQLTLPSFGLSARIERADGTSTEVRLTERLDHVYGHHYGAGIEAVSGVERVTVVVDSPPQVARHDGYETAFLAFDELEFEW